MAKRIELDISTNTVSKSQTIEISNLVSAVERNSVWKGNYHCKPAGFLSFDRREEYFFTTIDSLSKNH